MYIHTYMYNAMNIGTENHDKNFFKFVCLDIYFASGKSDNGTHHFVPRV